MKNIMKKICLGFCVLIFILIFPKPTYSGQLRIGLMAGYYLPSDSAYRDLYGQGNLIFSGSFSFELIRKLEARLEGGYFQDSGKMNLTKEDLSLSFLAGSVGARFRFIDRKLFQPYVGTGVAMYAYKEALPPRLGDVSKKAIGFQGEAGGYFGFAKRILLDLNFRYVFMNAKPFEETVKFGGIRAGLGIVYRF
jgi:opacity protein-like surface antigen